MTMTKKTKKEAAERVFEDGTYVCFLGNGEQEVEILHGCVVTLDGEIVGEWDEGLKCWSGIDAHAWLKRHPRSIGSFKHGILELEELRALLTAPPQENAPDTTAIAPEAGSNPDEEAQTDPSVQKKKNIRKPALRFLRFPLTPDEIEAKCAGVAKKSRAVDELESELARVRADYKGRIEKLQNEIRHDLRCVEEREESREVLADEVHDFEAAMVRYEYNGATYEQREMTPREKQMTIDGVL